MHRPSAPARTTLAALAIVAVLAVAASGAPIEGSSRDDTLVGTPRADFLRGLGGNDVVIGRGGPDGLDGGPGRDVLRGGGGADSIFAGAGRDTVSGGPGDDLVFVGADRARDEVVCGPDEDAVVADARDVAAADCEVVRRTLPQGSAPTPITVEFLGWTSSARAREPAPVTAVPDGAVASGGTLTACAPGDERLNAFFRARGIPGRTSTRTVLVFPGGKDFVDLDSLAPRDEGDLFFYAFLRPGSRGRAQSLPNGAYLIRFQVEAAGAYTTVQEASVTRSCA